MTLIESAYSEFLEDRKSQQLFRELTVLTPSVAGEVLINGVRTVNFSSNDYLGLSHHEKLIKRAGEWGARFGVGVGASRLVTGHLDLFERVEKKLAAFKHKEAALIFASGFQTNASVLHTLFDRSVLGEKPLVFADKLNHASMHFGCAAAGIKQVRYRHLDIDHLRTLMVRHGDKSRFKFILTETVFSMDGDCAPMAALKDLAQEHQAFLICDDAHGTGILGRKGIGLSEGADLVIGTFSKAMGSFGGYVACSKILRDYLINACGGFIYSTAPPPPLLGAIDAALDLLPEMDEERRFVADLAQMFRREVQAMGYDVGASTTQIVPLIVGKAERALSLSQTLRSHNILASAIRPPTVPAQSARLRFTFSAAHKKPDVETVLSLLSAEKKS